MAKTAIALLPGLVLKNLSGTNFDAQSARRVKSLLQNHNLTFLLNGPNYGLKYNSQRHLQPHDHANS